MCLYVVAYIWFVGNIVLCIHGGLGSWYYHHEGPLFPAESCWWLYMVMIFVSEPISCRVCLALQCRPLGFADKVWGCAVWAAGSLIATAGTQTLNLACACGRLCPSGTLSSSDPRTSWPAYSESPMRQWSQSSSECLGSRHGDTACNGEDWRKWHCGYCFSSDAALTPWYSAAGLMVKAF